MLSLQFSSVLGDLVIPADSYRLNCQFSVDVGPGCFAVLVVRLSNPIEP